MDLYQYVNMDSTKLSSSTSRHNSTLKVKAEEYYYAILWLLIKEDYSVLVPQNITVFPCSVFIFKKSEICPCESLNIHV